MPTPAEHAWMLAQLGTTHPQSLVTPKAELASMWTTTMERVVASSADIRTQLAANAEAPRWVLPAALAPEAPCKETPLGPHVRPPHHVFLSLHPAAAGAGGA